MTNRTLETLRRNLVAYLSGRGRRPADLARHLGKTDGWISHILSGRRRLRFEDVDQIAAFLEIHPGALFAEINEADIELYEEVFDDPATHQPPPRLTIAAPSGEPHASSRLKPAQTSDRIGRQQRIIEHQQDIIAHAVAHLKPLINILEMFAKVEPGSHARVRPTQSDRPSPPRARRPRSASHR